MATPLQPLAKCILNYIYSIASELLSKLRAIVEKALFFIDAKILQLRAFLAQYDLIKKYAELVNDQVQAIIDEIKSALLSGVPGPIDDTCPEFYAYITDPLIGLIDASLSAFTPYTDQWMSTVSVVHYYDQLIVYWVGIRDFLLAILDVIDDAAYIQTQRAGNLVP